MPKLNRAEAPALKPAAVFRLPAPEKRTLANGIPLYILNNAQSDLLHIMLQLPVGLLGEPQKHLTQFACDLLHESPPDRTPGEMADLMAFNGAHLDVEVTLSRTLLMLTFPKDKFNAVMPEIFGCLMRPRYREENLEIYRSLKIKDLEYSNGKTDYRSSVKMMQVMFGRSCPAGRPPARETLLAVTAGLMAEWHRQLFVAENMQLFVTGNWDDGMLASLSGLFRQVPHGRRAVAPCRIQMPADSTPAHFEEMPGCVQSSVVLCSPSSGYTDPEACGLSVLRMAAGGYFGSRLMQRVREKEGLSYGISCGTLYFGGQSLFAIDGEVNADRVHEALDAVFEELALLQSQPVTEEELSTVKSYMSGEMLRSVGNSVAHMKKFAFWKHHGLDGRAFNDHLLQIRSTTPEMLCELAKKHFDRNKFIRIVVGRKL